MSRLNLLGKIFGNLTVIQDLEKTTDWNSRIWLCKCICGKTKEVCTAHLTSGSTKSCGCLKSGPKNGHGLSKTLTYVSFIGMVNRCEELETDSGGHFKYYKQRGIKVCDRWITSFETFLSDMGERPGKEWTLDRIDPSKGYDPANCRWASFRTQISNRNKVRILNFLQDAVMPYTMKIS